MSVGLAATVASTRRRALCTTTGTGLPARQRCMRSFCVERHAACDVLCRTSTLHAMFCVQSQRCMLHFVSNINAAWDILTLVNLAREAALVSVVPSASVQTSCHGVRMHATCMQRVRVSALRSQITSVVRDDSGVERSMCPSQTSVPSISRRVHARCSSMCAQVAEEYECVGVVAPERAARSLG
eukprot:1609444-Pleurochrysis_carterae.AAC.1